MIGYVYLFQCENTSNYKIGTTRFLKKRKKQIQTSNAEKIIIIHEFESILPYKLESVLHKIYSVKKKEGEWFEFTQIDVNEFLSVCLKFEENFKILVKDNFYWQK
jgi:predicted GIY-YIG superfamily endonuclease